MFAHFKSARNALGPSHRVQLLNISALLWRPLMAHLGNYSIPLLKCETPRLTNGPFYYHTVIPCPKMVHFFKKARILKINNFNWVYIVVGFLGALNIPYKVIYFANAFKMDKLIYIHHRKIII